MVNRIKRVNQLLKEELGKILMREIDSSEFLLTITRVEAFPNLQGAKVYISIMPDERADEVFNFLNKNIYHFQQDLNKRLDMRPVPKIIFEKEEKTQEAARVEELLEEIKDKEDKG